jgi:hypothetical protein
MIINEIFFCGPGLGVFSMFIAGRKIGILPGKVVGEKVGGQKKVGGWWSKKVGG